MLWLKLKRIWINIKKGTLINKNVKLEALYDNKKNMHTSG